MPVFFIVLANSFCSHSSLKVYDFCYYYICFLLCKNTVFVLCHIRMYIDYPQKRTVLSSVLLFISKFVGTKF